MKVGVLGPKGMLGEAVIDALIAAEHEPIFYNGHIIVDKLDIQSVTRRCDSVINCLGRIPQRCHDTIKMIHSNAIIPHLLAGNFDGQIIHVSTDKVFSGRSINRNYFVSDLPSPTDIYGKSKVLGEVDRVGVTNVRTSFIGRKHGLLAWLISNDGQTVDGYLNAMWSGSSVQEVALGLVALVGNNTLKNIEHLCTSNAVSKYELLFYLVKKLGLNIVVRRTRDPYQNFSMHPTITIKSVVDLECI